MVATYDRRTISLVALQESKSAQETPQARMLRDALEGKALFPVNELYSQEGLEMSRARMARIRDNWQFFLNHHRSQDVPEKGERALVRNLTRAMVNKSRRWLTNPGWKIVSHDGNEGLVDFYESIWKANRKETLFTRMGLQGAISGDVFVWVGVKRKGERDYLCLRCLDSMHCHPVFDPSDPDRMIQLLYQRPVLVSESMKSFVPDTYPWAVQSTVITESETFLYYNEKEVQREDNLLGFVNVVHIPNTPCSASSFGQDEVSVIKDLNLTTNEVLSNLNSIVSYYAAPLTLMFGHTLGDIQRSGKQVWSGLKTDARVESLEQNADLAGAMTVADSMVEGMHEVSNVPAGSLTSRHSLSNVSEAALRVYFMPMLELLTEKHSTYGAGISAINEMIRRVCKHYPPYADPDELAKHDDPFCRFETWVDWNSPIPKDKQDEANEFNMRIANRTISRAEVIRRTAEDADPRRLAKEILQDMAQDMYTDQQRGMGALGVPVSYAGLAVGSLGDLSKERFNLDELSKTMQNLGLLESLLDLATRPSVKPAFPAEPAPPLGEMPEEGEETALESEEGAEGNAQKAQMNAFTSANSQAQSGAQDVIDALSRLVDALKSPLLEENDKAAVINALRAQTATK